MSIIKNKILSVTTNLQLHELNLFFTWNYAIPLNWWDLRPLAPLYRFSLFLGPLTNFQLIVKM